VLDPTTKEAEDKDGDVSWTSYLDRSSSEELSAVEVDTRIHKVMDLGVNPNPEVGPVPI
jgi:hypothetical protein